MLTLLQDFRFAARSLRKRPGYTVLAVLVLALAIGANTTVFSVLNGYLLRPLPYPDDAKLVGIYNTYPGLGIGVVAAFGIGRVLAAQIRDVSPNDPIVFAAAFVGLGATALLASWLPARRATRIDPLVALRHD